MRFHRGIVNVVGGGSMGVVTGGTRVSQMNRQAINKVRERREGS